jgi:hypothetical protein
MAEAFKDMETYLIRVEIEDFLTLREALPKAINIFNNKTEIPYKLNYDIPSFILYLAKKSGKPSKDLPPLSLSTEIKESKIDKIAVQVPKRCRIPKRDDARSTMTSESEREELDRTLRQEIRCCSRCLII